MASPICCFGAISRPNQAKEPLYSVELPEFQPIYDFENSEFSLWIAPEFGKVLAPGVIAYAKPGFGVNPTTGSGERDFTFEIGIRYFME